MEGYFTGYRILGLAVFLIIHYCVILVFTVTVEKSAKILIAVDMNVIGIVVSDCFLDFSLHLCFFSHLTDVPGYSFLCVFIAWLDNYPVLLSFLNL